MRAVRERYWHCTAKGAKEQQERGCPTCGGLLDKGGDVAILFCHQCGDAFRAADGMPVPGTEFGDNDEDESPRDW